MIYRKEKSLKLSVTSIFLLLTTSFLYILIIKILDYFSKPKVFCYVL